MGAIDATYQEFVSDLPISLRGFAALLPYHIGLVRQADAGWEDFVRIHPNRDLPWYAAEDPDRPGRLLVPDNRLERFRVAHRFGAFHGLVADRLMDNQVAPDPRIMELRHLLLRRWEATLTEASEERPLARRIIAEALSSLHRGVHEERAALRGKRLSAIGYVTLTADKLRWFGASADCLLLALHQARRAALLRRAYALFSLALQCIDDANDCEEDQAQRGASFPTLLRLPAGGLLCAARHLIRRAQQKAELGRFHRLSAWLDGLHRLCAPAELPGDPAHNELAARVLLWAAEVT